MPAHDPPKFSPAIAELLAQAKKTSAEFTQSATELCNYIEAFEAELCSFPGKLAVDVDNLDEKPDAAGKMPLRLSFKRTANAWGIYVDDARRIADETRTFPEAEVPDPAPSRGAAPIAPAPVAHPAPRFGPPARVDGNVAFVVPIERRLATETPLPVKAEAVQLFPKLLRKFIAEVTKKAAEFKSVVAAAQASTSATK